MRRLTSIISLSIAVLAGGVCVALDAYAAPAVAMIQIDGKKYKVPLPDGFCDETDSFRGIATLKFLRDLSSKNEAIPLPKAVFRLCNATQDQGFPWGYVGAYPKTKFINNQQSLNAIRKRFYGDKSFLKDIMKKSADSNAEVMNSYGFSSRVDKMSKPEIVFSDDNTIVSVNVSKNQINGLPYNEILFSAGTVLDGIVFEMATYDELGNHLNLEAYIRDLAKNAKNFKSMN